MTFSLISIEPIRKELKYVYSRRVATAIVLYNTEAPCGAYRSRLEKA